MSRKICVVTGTRADYGLLYWVMKEIEKDPDFQLQIIATGMHLSPEFGLTYKVIEDDGFFINDKVEMLMSSDSSVGVAKSIGLGVIGFADAFYRIKPDLVLVLGDRYEIFAAVQAAMIAKIPVAHIAGGDLTEGAYDDLIRHSITKMSHLHFVTNEAAAKRVRQLGENPQHIYNAGSPGIDQIKRLQLLSKEQLEKDLGFKFRDKNALITFHPVTLDHRLSATQFQQLLDALELISRELDLGLIFTYPNSDSDGRILIEMIRTYISINPKAKAYTSLGQLRYLSTIQYVDVVIGNSSSGLYEVPSFKKPTVNIGDRQKGRLQADSVIQCGPEVEKIEQAIRIALSKDCSKTVNPYGDGNSSYRIVKALKDIPDFKCLLKKQFFEVEFK